MKILELNFWKDFNEKYLILSAKYRSKIHKLGFSIISVKMWLKFGNTKITRFLLFCLSQVKNLNKDFKEVQVKPHEY
jgi:hypothetical protein